MYAGNQKNGGGWPFFLGLAIGAGAMYLLPSAWKTSAGEQGKKLAETVKGWLTDPQEQERLREMFAQNSEQAQATLSELRDSLSAKLSILGQGIQEIDKRKYKKILAEAVSELQQGGQVNEEMMTKLRQYLEEDFSQFQRRAQEAGQA